MTPLIFGENVNNRLVDYFFLIEDRAKDIINII